MTKDKAFVGIARLHYISKNVFELGDFFIFENFRGKTYQNKKYSQHLIEKTKKEAKKVNKDLKMITLAVNEENIPAIKLYTNNNFVEFENKSKFRLKSTKEHKFVYMKLDL
jgi:RimJ/RimL family protein N-acetyltransferase